MNRGNLKNAVKIYAHEAKSIVLRNDYVGIFDMGVKSQRNKVNLFRYHPQALAGYSSHLYNNSPYNLGDYLGEVIVKYLADRKGIDQNKDVLKTSHLFCVGSNIVGGERYGSYDDATIWGSGILFKMGRMRSLLQKVVNRKLDVRAVRGPLTREELIRLGYKCPEIHGDPAILMPMLYTPTKSKNRKYSVVLQFYHERAFREEHPDEPVISMNTDDYKSVIDEIVSSEIIYTSSLHGIILAEAYGVPAVFFRSLKKALDFKYKDWYCSTGRYDVPMADTFEEALKQTPPPLPDLREMQQGLLDTFPYDLWES